MEHKNNKDANSFKKIHDEAIRQFNIAQTTVTDEREQSLEDRRFSIVAGSQWEGDLGEQYENKPKFEINKILLSLLQIKNDYENNKITIDFVSDGNDNLSDLADKLYRADEQDCNGQEAYSVSFFEAVAGGMGAFRYYTTYEDDEDIDNDKQRIKWEAIVDADSCVFFDPSSKRQDKSDAEYCFVLSGISRDEFEHTYGKSPTSIGKQIDQSEYDWVTDDEVFVAEYYKIEYTYENINIFEDFMGNELKYKDGELNDELYSQLLSTGHSFEKVRKIKKQKVRKYIMDGEDILKDCGYIAGKYIPIVPVFGIRMIVDNIERCFGHVRLAKDAQRLQNMELSKLAELSALSSTEKPIVTPEQIVGHERMWEDDNIRDYPYLLLNPVTDAEGNEIPSPPVGYTKNPNLSPAMAALLQYTDGSLKEVLGNQQMGQEVRANISGDLMEMIHTKLDMQTFTYMSNMAKSLKLGGKIWLSMAKDIYVEENRKMKGVSKGGNIEYITLTESQYNKDINAIEYVNDLTKSNLEIHAEVAPSTSSKRAKTVRDISKMLPMVTDPELQNILSTTAIMNMEDLDTDIKSYLRKRLIRMGAIKPDETEIQELQAEMQQAQQPTKGQIYLESEAIKNQAQAQKYAADTAKTVAETQKVEAETVETLSKVDREEQEAAVNTAKEINNIIAQGKQI